MSSINTSLNYLLAANYSEVGKVAQQQQVRPPVDPVATQLQQALGRLKPGSNVNARFDYTVDAAGKLRATAISVKTGADPVKDALERDTEKHNFQQADARKQSFTQLLQPKPSLSPTDEIALYAEESLDDTSDPEIAATEEDGTPIEVQILPPHGQAITSKVVDLTDRFQRAASDLYARNSNIVYNVEPAIAFAA